ncbi:right-handed parallel beta-helix repeat-containing protein [Streptomyces sp.]|uniref:right-handed parallel beta-helix repeat-containing protein n=1 Tax=Streptomyces sp. TaxID=1931 RepID=UPI002F3E8463
MSHTPPPQSPPPGTFRLPGGPAVWLGGAALLVALVALIVAVAGSGGGSGPGETVGATSSGPRPSASSELPSLPDETPSAGPIVTDDPTPSSGTGGPTPSAPVDCPTASVTVNDARSLKAALAMAQPGQSIRMADGTYTGRFTATTPGTADQPIFLCGGAGAVIDGGGIKGGYAFHLDGASYWRLAGFTVRNGQKGVVADQVQGAVIQGLTVTQIGDEAIHLRKFSSDNVVRDNTISTTGLRRDKFGEGVYIGSAKSNWCTNSDCKPDASNNNVVIGNHISATTAESIDIKEGTTGGKVIGNTFDGSKLSGSSNDSWVDVKGNGWLVQGNTGRHSNGDGFQTHQILDGWGTGNIFKGNTAQVDGPGWGFHLTSDGNTVACDNKVTGAAQGQANINCTR